MDARHSLVDTLSHFIHKHLIWLLVGSYVAAGLYPSLGIWIRNVSFGDVTVLHSRVRICLPMLMLALLLYNAGLGVQIRQIHSLLRRPLVLLVGLLANSIVPVAFALCVGVVVRWWHNSE